MVEQQRDKQVKAESKIHPCKTISVYSIQLKQHLDGDLLCNLIPEKRALSDPQKAKQYLALGRIMVFLPYKGGKQDHV